MWTTTKMDIGFYPENEQFACNITPYLDYSGHHSSFFGWEFENFSATPEPPSQIFEWEGNDVSNRLQPEPYFDVTNQRPRVNMGHLNAFAGTIGTPVSIGAPMSIPVSLVPRLPGIEYNAPLMPTRENKPAPTRSKILPMVPLGPTCYEYGHCNSVLTPITKNVPEVNETNANCDPASIPSFEDCITGDTLQLNPQLPKLNSTFNPDSMLMSECRRQSVCSDILNTSFTSTDLANFDISEYIFDEDKPKQPKQSPVDTRDQVNSFTSTNNKTEIISEGCNTIVKSAAKQRRCKPGAIAGGKKLDLIAQKYVVADIKKSNSEDEDDVDIETVAEEGPRPILQAGNIVDLLEQFEATEMTTLEENLQDVDEKCLKAPKKTEKTEEHVPAKVKGRGRKRKTGGALKPDKPEKDSAKLIVLTRDPVKPNKPEKDNVKSPKNAEKNNSKRAKIETTDVKPDASLRQEQLSRDVIGIVKPKAQQEQLVKNYIASTAKPPAKAKQVLKKNIVNTVKPPTAQQAQLAQKNIVNTIKPKAKEEKLVKNNSVSAVKPTPQQEKLVKKDSTSAAKTQAKPEPVLNKSIVNTPKLPTAQPQKNAASTIKLLAKQETLTNGNTMSTVKIRPIQGATTSLKPSVLTESSHFMNCYPTELINRIKKSEKRKTITVIDPIPHNHIKRRKVQDSCNKVVVKTVTPINRHTVQLDHNYAAKKTAYNDNVGIVNPPASNKKDPPSTLCSSNEDNKKVIIGQPMTKNADGTLTISLLKSNTISQPEQPLNKRKTLNLGEYLKRRNQFEVTKNSHENSPPSTSISSQRRSEPETEYQKMLKHQEKLRRMAQEVLKAAPKTDRGQKSECNSSVLQTTSEISGAVRRTGELKVKTETQTRAMIGHSRIVAIPPRVPPNLERKICVSIGVNTDFRIPRDQDPLAPLETLEELKPLLEQSSHRINDQSLISSVMQHVPKVVQQRDTALSARGVSTEVSCNSDEHGECKEVIYLKKDRVRQPTKSTTTQTNISLIRQRSNVINQITATSSRHTSPGISYRTERQSRYTRGSYTSSRGSETSPGSMSISSASSFHSSASWSRLSSHSESRSSTRSPPPSRRPRYARSSSTYREYLKAVEERRIIYVGKLPRGTTKEDLYRKFSKFGHITKVTLHLKHTDENYGFVNFELKESAHEAYARGNEDPKYPPYQICFGGRREFCQCAYSDLDYVDNNSYYEPSPRNSSYDDMLKDMLNMVHLRKA